MALTAIQTTLKGRQIGLSAEGYLVVNLADGYQLTFDQSGMTATTPLGVTTRLSGSGGAVHLADLLDIASYDLGTNNPSVAAIKATANAAPTTMAGLTDKLTFNLATQNLSVAAIKATADAAPTTMAGLSDKATYDLGTNNASVAAIKATADAAPTSFSGLGGLKTINGSSIEGVGNLVVAGVGGQVDATNITPFAAPLPFDVTGFGSRVVNKTLSAALTLSVGPGAVEGGACEVTFIGDGNPAHTVNFPPGWKQRGTDVIDTASNHATKFAGEYTQGTVVYVLLPLGATAVPDTTPPTLLTATVPDSDPFRISLLWSEPINNNGVGAAPFAVNSGHPLTGHTYVDSTNTFLITSTKFVPGETKTLAYTTPGTNKFADLAGNLLADFVNFTITDNVTAPTLISATVANATPSQINLVWSEPMNATISASAAFAVSSGHTLTAHTYVDTTHTYLTTSAAFVASETKTLAYTVPGSNPMQDLGGTPAGSFSGTAITDNVSGGAKVTFTDTFTGADASAPNARWTLRDAGWEINTNHLRYTGSSFGIIYATCTAGDNTLSADVEFSNALFSFAIISPRFVDGNNYVDVSLNASEVLQIREIIGGAVVGATTTDTGGTRTASACNISVAMVGNLCTVTVTGGSNPGNFSATVSGTFATATLVALGMNTSKTTNYFDNVVLA